MQESNAVKNVSIGLVFAVIFCFIFIAIIQRSTRPEPQDKVAAESFYLPAGTFMDGKLLNGMYAPTDPASDPIPVIVRISSLAKLPNSVKADLKGCFMVGEAHGNLVTAKAEIRLTEITCLNNKGKSVIDEQIAGFVVDPGGMPGVNGTVRAIENATVVATVFKSMSASLPPGSNSKQLAKFYSERTKQISPVVGVDPGKSVILVLSKGSRIKISR